MCTQEHKCTVCIDNNYIYIYIYITEFLQIVTWPVLLRSYLTIACILEELTSSSVLYQVPVVS